MCLVLGQESSQLAWNLSELHLIMKLKKLCKARSTDHVS